MPAESADDLCGFSPETRKVIRRARQSRLESRLAVRALQNALDQLDDGLRMSCELTDSLRAIVSAANARHH